MKYIIVFLTLGNSLAYALSSGPIKSPGVSRMDPQSHIRARRNFIVQSVGFLASNALLSPQPAFAIPSISTSEFMTILRDSGRSISRVEFSGPKSDTVEVVLQDGTRFGINDVVESSVDPRSPLKISALCRENGVATQFVDLQRLVSTTGGPKKKLYSNSRVQEAAAKEREKAARMESDERERLEALGKIQQSKE